MVNLPVWSGRAVAICRDCARHTAVLVEKASTVYSVTGVPCASVTVPVISLTRSLNVTTTPAIFCPLRTSIGVSVTSRPPISTDFRFQPRSPPPPLGRMKCWPTETPSMVNVPSLLTRGFGVGPMLSSDSVEGADNRTCVRSEGGAVVPA